MSAKRKKDLNMNEFYEREVAPLEQKSDEDFKAMESAIEEVGIMQPRTEQTAARFMGEVFSPELAKRINETVLRASGLSHITQAGKFGFGMEFFRTLARYSDIKWNNLDSNFKGFLERQGFGETQWDIIRTTPKYEHKGVTFIRPDDIFQILIGIYL